MKIYQNNKRNLSNTEISQLKKTQYKSPCNSIKSLVSLMTFAEEGQPPSNDRTLNKLHLTYCIITDGILHIESYTSILHIASYTLFLYYTLHLKHFIVHIISFTSHLKHNLFRNASFTLPRTNCILHILMYCILNIVSDTLHYAKEIVSTSSSIWLARTLLFWSDGK